MRHARLVASCGAMLSAMTIGVVAARADAGAPAVSDYAAVTVRAAAGDLDAARVLRAAGPTGLSALLDAGVADAGRGVALTSAQGPGRALDPQALDLVCAQVGCASSRLYWFTDFGAARREAERTGRPIVALRLLGRLDEELSCANSRYFRLVLYSDPAIAGWLRDHAVLYWSSERPVPKVTIDYGDGRRLVGTVTGNSIHYLLDPHGRLVDALPGLNAPHRFLSWLRGASALAGDWTPLSDAEHLAALQAEHAAAERRLLDDLEAQLVARGWSEAAAVETWGGRNDVPVSLAKPPTATEAAALALSKAFAEAPALASFGPPPQLPPSSPAISVLMLAPEWRAELSAPALALLEAQAPAPAREDLTGALIRLVNRLSEDGLRNEAYLHRSIHARLAQATSASWQELNAWVYATLFLTPAADPWLGLAPTELLSALQPDAL